MSKRTRLQNPVDFTVQICHPSSGTCVGTGIAVSLDGLIITCGHIVQAAGAQPHEKNGAEVVVFFPQAHPADSPRQPASVLASLPYTEDDIVLLRLLSGETPLAPEQLAVLGTAELSTRHRCRSFGYSVAAEGGISVADGSIIGPAEPPANHRLQAAPLYLHAPEAAAFVSGAAVLDIERNLVVGIVNRLPNQARLDAQTFQAVNARILGELPFHLPLHDTPVPLRPAPQPRIDIARARSLASLVTGTTLQGTPPAPPMWVGRADLLQALANDWADPERRMVVLVGAGGEGKSSLALHWLSSLQTDRSQAQPDGIFWWNFQHRPNPDAFFEAAMSHLSGRLLDTHQYPSSSERVQIIGAMLRQGHYLFVLDGLEAVQQRQGSRSGQLASDSLRELLHYFAAPESTSFCLLTSRLPLPDMLAYRSVQHRSVGELAVAEGRMLLRHAGLRGDDQTLDELVHTLAGHAFSLKLLGAYVMEKHNGSITGIDMLLPTDDEPRPARIQQFIERRLRLLSRPERTLLTLLCLFRLPVDELVFSRVLRPRSRFGRWLLPAGKGQGLTAPLQKLKDAAFDELRQRLQRQHLLAYDTHMRQYYLPALIASQVASETPEASTDPPDNAPDNRQDNLRSLHLRISDYYLALAGEMPHYITMGDVEPLIEAVFHACRAEAYAEAFRIYWQRIEQGERQAFRQQLGAYETLVALMLAFFPDAGTAGRLPLVPDSDMRDYIFDTLGFCLISLERVREAAHFAAARNQQHMQEENWYAASSGQQHLAGLYLLLGEPGSAREAAEDALQAARQLGNTPLEIGALARRGRVYHLQGELFAARDDFEQAASLQRESSPAYPYLASQEGIWYAEHLCHIGNPERARRITEANLELCNENHWLKSASQCHRLLGYLETIAIDKRPEAAAEHYEQAVVLARQVAHPPTLIEALLARGRGQVIDATEARKPHQAATPVPAEALDDLYEALGYSTAGGYRIYEAQIRSALSLALQQMGDASASAEQKRRAHRIAAALGYDNRAV